jgi:hypothetical protein
VISCFSAASTSRARLSDVLRTTFPGEPVGDDDVDVDVPAVDVAPLAVPDEVQARLPQEAEDLPRRAGPFSSSSPTERRPIFGREMPRTSWA